MTNGIVLLNLGDRNAAEFSRLEVPGSYDKVLGALTAGTYVNVYKWLYQGFALTASICTVEDMDTYLLLKDKTKGGEMRVYPDDTISIAGGSDFPEFNLGGVDFVDQSLGPENIQTLISQAVEVSNIVMAVNFSVEGSAKGPTITSVAKFKDMENTTFYTMENSYFKYSASQNWMGQSYVEFFIKEE